AEEAGEPRQVGDVRQEAPLRHAGEGAVRRPPVRTPHTPHAPVRVPPLQGLAPHPPRHMGAPRLTEADDQGDAVTERHVTVIKQVLNGLPAGTRFTVDQLRDAAEAAQLRPHEINAAIRWAVTHGWLRPIRAEYGYVCQPTRHG